MPLPMVHLSVAWSLAQEIDVPDDTGLYYVGSIAPDGIHARPNTTREDKRRVHLASDRTQSLRDRLLGVDRFVREWKAKVDPGFLLGWATHLVADSIWSRHVVRGAWDNVTEGLEKTERDQRYYAEADQADMELFASMPWRAEVWEHLCAATIPDFADLLTAKEVSSWRDRIVRWYAETEVKPIPRPLLITIPLIQQFVGITVTLLKNGVSHGFAEAIGTVPGIEGSDLFRTSQASYFAGG